MGTQFRDDSEALDFLHRALESDSYGQGPSPQDRTVVDVPVPSDSPHFGATQPDEAPQFGDGPPRIPLVPPKPGPKRAVIITKQGSPIAPPDEELASTQDFAAKRRRGALLGLAGAHFADALTTPNARTSNEFWDKYGAEGDTAVKDLATKRAGAKEAMSAAEAAESKDPNSGRSQRAQALWARLSPSSAEAVKGMSEAEIIRHAPQLTEALKEGNRAALEATKKTDEAAKNDREKTEEAERFERNKGATDDRTDKMIKAGLYAQNFGSNLTEGRQRLAEEESQKSQKEKEGREAQFGIPEGYEASGHPSNEQKTKFAAAAASAEKMRAGIAEVKTLLGKTKGVGRLVGEDARALDRLVTQLGIEGKNIAELGALSGPDYALMAKLVQNPTDPRNILAGDSERAMDDLQAWTDRALQGSAKAFGIHKKGAGGGVVQMRFPDGSTHPVPAADVERARRKGGVEVGG